MRSARLFETLLSEAERLDLSPAGCLRRWPIKRQESLFRTFQPYEIKALNHSWEFWSRPAQRMPEGEWFVWLIRCGRGWGKTRTGAEAVREAVYSGVKQIHLVGKTASDVRNTMVENKNKESGILDVFPPHQRPHYEPSKKRITFHTGAVADLFTSEEPALLRGPEAEFAWADELAAWIWPEAWDNLLMGMRIGNHPRVVVTTTPQPKRTIKDLIKAKDTIETRGSTYDNMENLSPRFIKMIREKFEGTSKGRQELWGDMLEDAEGSLWKRAIHIDPFRVSASELPELKQIVVALDPSVKKDGSCDAAGIIVTGESENGHDYVIEDRTLNGSPLEWAASAIVGYEKWEADEIVAEENQGGEMVRITLHTVDEDVPVTLVRAKRGKRLRAEPVVARYEQGKVHHVGGLTDLEDEQCNWVPGDESPNRLDAVVYGITALRQARPSIIY